MATLQSKTLGKWEEALTRAQEMKASFLNNTDETLKELEARANKLHSEVDSILFLRRQTLREIKTSGLARLQDYEQYLANHIHKLKENEGDVKDQIRERTLLPALETVPLSVFVPGKNNIEAIQELFGQISPLDESQTTTWKKYTSNTEQAQSSADIETASTTPSSVTETSERSLLTRASVQSKFKVSTSTSILHSTSTSIKLACTEDGMAWLDSSVNNGYGCSLQLIDKSGAIKNEIDVDFAVRNMDLTPDGDIIVADHDNFIKSISIYGEINTLFRACRNFTSICCLHNNNLAVAYPDTNNSENVGDKHNHDSRVVVYSTNGHIKQTLSNIKFYMATKVATNKLNHDIYVCDQESYFFPKVMALTANGTLRYEYAGHNHRFKPVDVCTDQMGHVLIADYGNNAVLILDQEGQMVQHIPSSDLGLAQLSTINVDGEGYLWIGWLRKQSVVVAKYLELNS